MARPRYHLKKKVKVPLTERAMTRRVAWLLSLAGWLPFGALTVGLWMLPPEHVHYPLIIGALKTYGAVILSFLGGMRWGVALKSSDEVLARKTFVFAVLPSLLAWFSLYLPVPYVFAVLALGFAGQGAWDAFSGDKGAFGQWFVKLRIVLTLMVSGALIMAFFATVKSA